MANELKIEAGKRYRTVSGKEVRIYATDGSYRYPIHGAIKRYGGWEIESWTEDGYFDEHRPSGLSIKEEIK